VEHDAPATARHARELPSALEAGALDERLGPAVPVVFLDYDGVLTEIVEDPAAALLADERRRAVAELARRTRVAVVSGRDLRDVRRLVAVDGLVYAGSHGLDIDVPGGAGLGAEHGAEDFLPALDGAQAALERRLAGVPGARVERKRFALAVHFRQVAPADVDRVAQAVGEVAAEHPELRRTGGKKVFELRPRLPWDKGRAVLWLLDVLGLDRDDVVPLYLGDDETDEDAFRALARHGRGFGVLVGDHGAPTAARYRLRDPDEARAFLERLSARLDERADAERGTPG
jgi:trehalose-phosphatase